MKKTLFIVTLFACGLSVDALIIGDDAPKGILEVGQDSTTNQSAIPSTNPSNPSNLSNQGAIPSANNADTANNTQNQAQTNTNQKSAILPKSNDPDERLKDDILNFERERHIQNSANVDDPFIYIYSQSEDEVAIRAKLEQTVLTLKSIIVAPDENGVKQYKAHINNQWVGECKLIRKAKVCDSVEGWEVRNIDDRGVKLRVARYNLSRDLEITKEKVTIKQKDSYK